MKVWKAKNRAAAAEASEKRLREMLDDTLDVLAGSIDRRHRELAAKMRAALAPAQPKVTPETLDVANLFVSAVLVPAQPEEPAPSIYGGVCPYCGCVPCVGHPQPDAIRSEEEPC